MIFKKLLRKVIVLILIIALGYGCWALYSQNRARSAEIGNAFASSYRAVVEELTKDEPDPTETVRQGAVMRAMYQKSKYNKGDETDLTQVVEALYSASANPSDLPINEETKTILLDVYQKEFSEKSVKAAKERIDTVRSVLS